MNFQDEIKKSGEHCVIWEIEGKGSYITNNMETTKKKKKGDN